MEYENAVTMKGLEQQFPSPFGESFRKYWFPSVLEVDIAYYFRPLSGNHLENPSPWKPLSAWLKTGKNGAVGKIGGNGCT